LRRLELSVHGIPGEMEWKGLGWRFAPDRFAGVSREGRLEMLGLVEWQRIHEKQETEPLCDWLIDVAFGSSEPDVRIRALEIHAERSPRGHGLDVLTKPDYRPAFARAFDVPTILHDRSVGDYLREVLRKDVVLPDAGKDLIEALLRAVGRPAEIPEGLRQAALDFLEKQAATPAWRDVVVPGLAGLGKQDHDLAERCGRLAARLRPPPPPPRPRHPKDDSGGDEDSEEVPLAQPVDQARLYAEKAKIAEQLGRELQEQCLLISFGAGSPQEKTAEIMKLQDAFQKRIQELYGA
jgi:hypothetical protein